MNRIAETLRDLSLAPACVAFWCVVSVVAAVAGPFGTYTNYDFGFRLLYWAAVSGAAIMALCLARATVDRMLPALSYWQQVLASNGVLGLFLAGVPLVIADGLPDPKLMEPFGINLVLSALLVSVSVHLLTGIFGSGTQPAPKDVPRVIRRLPEQIRGELIRITARDHYVEFHTDKGMHSLLMRLRDATEEAEADGLDGFCVHRSHWVSRGAITGVESDKGRMVLKLKDGSRVPVGRKYRVNVEAAGFL